MNKNGNKISKSLVKKVNKNNTDEYTNINNNTTEILTIGANI